MIDWLKKKAPQPQPDIQVRDCKRVNIHGNTTESGRPVVYDIGGSFSGTIDGVEYRDGKPVK